MAVTLLSQSAITLYTYNKNPQAKKDLNFYWSVLVLIVSIIVTVVSGFGLVMAFRESGGGGAANPDNYRTEAARLEALAQAQDVIKRGGR